MKRIVLSVVWSLLFVYLSASAQEIAETPVITYSLTNNYKKYTIAEINIKGVENYGYQDYVLASISGLSVGDKVSIPGEKITSALKAFLKQGLFSWGQILATKQTEDSVWLEIILQPNPVISDINFTGLKKNEREELETKIGMMRGSQSTPNLMNHARKRVKDYLDEKGFSNAEIKVQQKNDIAHDGKVIIDIAVNKNQKVKIRRIHIIGNNELSDYVLKMTMKKTNEGFSLKERPKLSLRKLFSSNKFIREEYSKDLENIILKYNERGYRDACIVSDSVVAVNEKQVDIYLTIDEGNKYYIRSINWVGNKLYSSEDLGRMLDMKARDVYNQRKLHARLLTDEDAVSNLYYNNGYIFSFMEPVEVYVGEDSIDVEIRVSEGIQATINRITINGNDRVFENVIRRELVTKPGQLFSKEALMRSAREIAQMGHFDPETMDIQPIPDPESGTVDIDYNLTSKANDQIEFSAGWGGQGLVGRLSLKFSNFSIRNLTHLKEYKGIIPQGESQTLTLSGQTNGRYYQSYSVSFLEPWFGGKRPNSLSLSTYYMMQTGTESSSNNQYIKIFGLSTGYGKRLNWPDNYFTLMSDISYQHYWLNDWNVFPVHTGMANSLTLGLTLGRNSIDNPLYTRCGSTFSLSVSATPPYSLWDGRDYGSLSRDTSVMYKWIEYHKWKFKGKIFLPLANRDKVKRTPVLMNRIEYGFVGTYNSKKYNPFETFDMGGDGMTGYSTVYANEIIGLRGYEASTLTPEGGGYAYARLALELRFPFVLEQTSTIYGLAFMEAGNAWASIGSFAPFDLKRSAGVGIRILLPMIGLMGFDWAYGFDKPNSGINLDKVSGPQFHFILGQEF